MINYEKMVTEKEADKQNNRERNTTIEWSSKENQPTNTKSGAGKSKDDHVVLHKCNYFFFYNYLLTSISELCFSDFILQLGSNECTTQNTDETDERRER